ncbi:sensor histidine kinase [Candidatus Leptofilum sp.]|uniref:sensor histidine kinase n=1 Tax=Candidatus Leptofilum sp. TaxID=3241576 RepID=UPI003B5A20B4
MTWFIADEPSGTILSGSMAAVSIILFMITKKKKIRLVSTVLVIAGYAAIMVTLTLNGGIRDEATLVLIALLSIAGFLLGMRAVIPMGIGTAVLLTTLFIAEKVERIPEEEHFAPVAADELAMALIAVFVTTVVLHQFTKQILQNRDEIKAQAQFLHQKNLQLEETHQALIVAKEAAEDANRSRSIFFSRLSHDLRTPLSSILGLTTHLRHHEARLLPAEKQEFYQGIHNSGTHLLDLINDLLDISRLEAQQLQLHVNPALLSTLAENVVGMLRLTAEKKGLDLQLFLADDLPEVIYVDEQRLRQVLINLLGNGIKFTEAGKVTLTVTASDLDTAVPTLCFEVTDTGCGIARHDLQKIFDPFVQVAENPQQANGTGLGLAISRQLIEAMGGTLQVESQLGQGSRFWFSLQLPETAPS